MRITPRGAAALVLASVTAACSSDEPTSPHIVELDRARQATLRYADVAQAIADGYVDINVVMPNMGRHFMKQSLVDERFEVEKPELLVYSPEGGQLKLVAVEYAVPLDRSATAPEGFASTSDVWDKNAGFQLWLLHAWVHKDNPQGVFNSTNSQVP